MTESNIKIEFTTKGGVERFRKGLAQCIAGMGPAAYTRGRSIDCICIETTAEREVRFVSTNSYIATVVPISPLDVTVTGNKVGDRILVQRDDCKTLMDACKTPGAETSVWRYDPGERCLWVSPLSAIATHEGDYPNIQQLLDIAALDVTKASADDFALSHHNLLILAKIAALDKDVPMRFQTASSNRKPLLATCGDVTVLVMPVRIG